MSNKCFMNPNVFFTLEGYQCIVWNYIEKNEFELDISSLQRLVQIKNHGYDISNEIDRMLLDMNIISPHPYKVIPWGAGLYAKIYHYGSKSTFNASNSKLDKEEATANLLDVEKKLLDHSLPDAIPDNYDSYDIIKLPNPQKQCLLENFIEVLTTRKTSRHMNEEPVTQEVISNILYYTFSFQAPADPDWSDLTNKEGMHQFLKRRTSPSGGSLQSTMPYLLALNVEGLQKGVYFYDSNEHNLRLINAIDVSNRLGEFFGGQYWASDYAFGVFFVSKLNRMWAKYKNPVAYRVALLDVGHLSQTMQLCATANGLNCWPTAAIFDYEVEKILNISDSSMHVMLFVGAGYSTTKGTYHPYHHQQLKSVTSKKKSIIKDK